MSNYRVRQVMALRRSRRDRDFLIGLATWMRDDSRSVTVSMTELMPCTGLSHNTFREAYKALEADGSLKIERGCGRGKHTTWTALCLPVKGTSSGPDSKGTSSGPVPDVKGTSSEALKGTSSDAKGDQPQRADVRERDHWLYMAKDSGSAAARRASADALLAAADDVPDGPPAEVEPLLARFRSGNGHKPPPPDDQPDDPWDPPGFEIS